MDLVGVELGDRQIGRGRESIMDSVRVELGDRQIGRGKESIMDSVRVEMGDRQIGRGRESIMDSEGLSLGPARNMPHSLVSHSLHTFIQQSPQVGGANTVQ